MKHLVIDTRESGTSTGRYIDKLVEHLHSIAIEQADSFPFTVTLLVKPHRLDHMTYIAPRFQRETCPHKEFTFAEQIALKRQLDNLKADLVHFPAVQQPAWYRGRVVTTMQDLTTLRFRNPAKNQIVFLFKQQVYRWLNHRIAHKSTLLITPTQFVKDDIVQFSGVSPDKITVTLESADDLPTPAAEVHDLVGKKFIMYVGRPTPHKNLERLVKSFGKLSSTNPDLYLALAGKKDANYERIEREAIQQGIERIHFTGFVSDEQLRWMYENCQAYVFPSLSEGFGLPGLEAMRHGAPVVSSNATCLPEVHGDACIYFDPMSVEDMAEKIATMINDDQLRATYSARGRKQAALYSWNRMAKQTLEVYKKALASADS